MRNSMIACAMIFLLSQCAPQKNKATVSGFDYDAAWKEVTAKLDKGLPESAIKIVNEIGDHAKEEKNSGQLVKVIIHQLKFTQIKEEDALVKNLVSLRKEADQAVFPVKPLLHSMLAEMYGQYYQRNLYRFHDRTETRAVVEEDIATWSLEKILSETSRQYTLSLADADLSKKERIDIFEPVILPGNVQGKAYRPTLYDFLAHRALDFYMSDRPYITKPAQTFILDKEVYLSEASAFARLDLNSKDTLSTTFNTLLILQELTRFHMDDDNAGALAQVDLVRLNFVRTHLTTPGKDELYYKALQQLEQKVKANPIVGNVMMQRAQVHVERAALYKPLINDAHKWDLKDAYQICEEGKKLFPGSDGAILCESLQHDILNKTIDAEIERNNIPAAPFRSLIRYRNFTDLHYRIIKVTRDEVDNLRQRLQKNHDDDQHQKFLEYFVGKSPLKTGVVKLPDDGDYHEHSIEIKLEALPEGEYMVLYSHRPDFKVSANGMAYAFTTISNIAYINRSLPDGSTEVYTLHRETGEPLPGVSATVYENRYNNKKGIYELAKVGSHTSDAMGYIKIAHIRPDNYGNFSIDFTKGSDFNSTEPIGHGNYYDRSASINQYVMARSPRERRTIFFLDRAIYRPGQTIHFKGLIFNGDRKDPKIEPGYSTGIRLIDVNGQERVSIRVKTNEYGSFSGVFTAPSTGLTGIMRIENQDGTGEAAFSVEEYKRPKFEVRFDSIAGSFRLNDLIKVTGHALALSGANVDGAVVKYRVTRVANFPLWAGYRLGNYPSSPQVEIVNGTSVTDADGKFEIGFSAVPDLSIDRASDPTFTYQVYADITDINGETRSSTTTIDIGYKSLIIGADVGEIDQADKNLRKQFNITTVNLAGRFQPAKGQIKISLLKAPARTFRQRLWAQPDRQLLKREEYYSTFPHDLYEDEENKFKWPKERDVLTVDFDTEKHRTFTLEDFSTWAEGEYVLEITSIDKDGQAIRELNYFTVYNHASKKVATPAVHDHHPLRMTVEPDDKASFTTGTTEDKISVLYEIEMDGLILSKEWITLKNEQRLFEIPIKEEYRGNISVHYSLVKNSRLYSNEFMINVPFTNKELDISFASFRDKLQPGAQEQWKIIVKGKKADKVAAEMVATLYDASLDEFKANNWYAKFYNPNYSRLQWGSANGFNIANFSQYTLGWNKEYTRTATGPEFDQLNWFEVVYSDNYGYLQSERLMAPPAIRRSARRSKNKAEESQSMNIEAVGEVVFDEPVQEVEESAEDSAHVLRYSLTNSDRPSKSKQDLSDVKIRKNFNETAFFYPQLMTNEKGEIIINFTIPEALTRWKMLGFAHTKDLKSGMITNQLVTQKDIMVVPNQPRFFRENDKMQFSAKISSLEDKELKGQVQLEFFDALTMKPINDLMKNKIMSQNFSLKPRQSTSMEWNIEIPESIQAIMYRIVAKAGDFSDGEEMVLPVVTNRMLVTETMPLPVRGKQTKEFRFEKLLTNKSTTLRHQRYTLEYTSNPAWYAIQSLPYLMEYPYDCVEQTFSKFYANSIASHIANSNPRIKHVFDTWKTIQPDALLSNLEKNQELKSALLEETPWVLQAKSESERKRMVGVLFDLNRMANEKQRAWDKIMHAQHQDGGFSWFPGFRPDTYMTQHIIAGMGHLEVMGVRSISDDAATRSMITNAIRYIDLQMQEDYDRLKSLAKRNELKLEENHISYLQYHYLYARSYYKDIPVRESSKEGFDYFLGQAKKYWTQSNLYTQGMTCLAVHRFGDKVTPKAMVKSFTERALHSDEMGMYWKNDVGYYWYQAPIETQVLMIEVYDEVAQDNNAVADLKAWLLKQKQTQDWKTTKATVEACYALLRRGTDVLASSQLVDIKVGNEAIDPMKRPDAKVEAGTGYFKTSWQATEIKPAMGKITVSKTDEGVAWGAVYWQYFEQLDKITPAETPLKLKKDLFLQKPSDRGPVITPVTDKTPLHVGDLVKVRIELRADRDMEYVHLKDMRAAAFEPVSTLSESKYQDGLFYYESPRDLATNFFIGYLPKGTYVFEYALRVSQKGDFSNGVTTIQCMYAPEFSSHSQGIRVEVK
jgi:hypothetical protein